MPVPASLCRLATTLLLSSVLALAAACTSSSRSSTSIEVDFTTFQRLVETISRAHGGASLAPTGVSGVDEALRAHGARFGWTDAPKMALSLTQGAETEGELQLGELVFKTTFPTAGYASQEVISLAARSGVALRFDGSSKLQSLSVNLLPSVVLLLLLGLIFFELKGNITGHLPGRSRKAAAGFRLEEVIGIDPIRPEVDAVISFLRDAKRTHDNGLPPRKGILLYGEAGCGKTMLARAIAAEAGASFFHYDANHFGSPLVSVTPRLIAKAFRRARRHAPAVIFIDEIDAIAAARSSDPQSLGDQEHNRVVASLLTALDGFERHAGKPVILIGATNLSETLDPALLRPGRMDTKLLMTVPDLASRKAIAMRRLASSKACSRLDADQEAEKLAAVMVGASAAAVARVVEEAVIQAERDGPRAVESADIDEAIETVLIGPRSCLTLTPDARKVAAYHEAGHAVVAHRLGAGDVIKVSIEPRGRSLGSTLLKPKYDPYLKTGRQLLQEITILVSGRAAESLAFSDTSTGSAEDLRKARELASIYVDVNGTGRPITEGSPTRTAHCGISESFLQPGHRGESESRQRQIDAVISRSDADASAILQRHWSLVHALADKLLRDGHASGKELDSELSGRPAPV
jgi:cell division protease FtsH